jgi:hypothetical protein
MRVVVTTIARGAPRGVPSGWLRVVDLEPGAEVARVPLPESRFIAYDPNPRGGLRGGRGLAVFGDRLVLAGNDWISILDPSWRQQVLIEHPLLSSVHDVLADGDGIWATCASNDCVLRLGWDGELRRVWTWRSHARLRGRLGQASAPPLDRGHDYRRRDRARNWHDLSHVNAILRDGDDLLIGLGQVRAQGMWLWPAMLDRALRRGGRPVEAAVGAWRRSPLKRVGRNWGAGRKRAPLPPGVNEMGRGPGSRSAVVRLSLNRRRRARADLVLLRPGATVPTHNLATLGDLLVVNDTSTGRLVALDPPSFTVRHEVRLPGSPSFPRGLIDLGGGRFLVGDQNPLAVHVVDLPAGTVERTVELPADQGECVYALAAVPPSFADPARRLPAAREAWSK